MSLCATRTWVVGSIRGRDYSCRPILPVPLQAVLSISMHAAVVRLDAIDLQGVFSLKLCEGVVENRLSRTGYGTRERATWGETLFCFFDSELPEEWPGDTERPVLERRAEGLGDRRCGDDEAGRAADPEQQLWVRSSRTGIRILG